MKLKEAGVFFGYFSGSEGLSNKLKGRGSVIQYLLSGTTTESRSDKLLTASVLLVWLLTVITLSVLHEPWRDEVRALSIATGTSFGSLFSGALLNEGHPILWYLLLNSTYTFTHSTLVLKVVSIVIAFTAILVFYLKSFFPNWMKIMFLFTILPLYLYAVVARNYGISMLFLFLFAYEYSRKSPRAFIYLLWLALLANSNTHSLVLAGLLYAYCLSKAVIPKAKLHFQFPSKQFVIGSIVLFATMLFSVITVTPDETSTVAGISNIQLGDVFHMILQMMIHPGTYFDIVFHVESVFVRDLVIWILFFGLLIKPRIAVVFILSVILLGSFFGLVYQGYYRHQGLIFIFVIALYWIASAEVKRDDKRKFRLPLIVMNRVSLSVLIPLVFLFHLRSTQVLVANDIMKDYSSSKAMAQFLATHDVYNDAILMSEPDYYLESLPYYADNDIYFPREERYGKVTSFTKENRTEFSLSEFLKAAQRIEKLENRPVLMLFGLPELANEDSVDYPIHYNRHFTWAPDEFKAFHEATEMLVDFQSALTENYAVYRLK